MANLGEGGDPTLNLKQYSHLPTPQSPHHFGQYIPGAPYSGESPATPSTHRHSMSTPVGQRSIWAEARMIVPPPSQQMFTPESSPFVRPPSRYGSSMIGQYILPISLSGSSAKGDASISYLSEPPISLAPAPHISSSVSPFEERTSHLSSPFMTKLSVLEQASDLKLSDSSQPQSYSSEHNDGVFSLQDESIPRDNNRLASSSPLALPPPQPPKPVAGGEMQRIRQAFMRDGLAYLHEAESRRPDYLKRAKRTLSEADPTALDEGEAARQRDREALVGITESPNKGRRLKLFQETSEESFEESLMAGGYGRYRTAEWVRQPQPVLVPTPGPAGPSNVVSILEQSQEVPPTEKELKKRKRLAAFSGLERHEGPIAKLHPVELEGRGRVLLDLSAEEEINAPPEYPLAKKKGGARRKKKGGDPVAKEKKASAPVVGAGADLLEKPNWPDTEFPWRLRQHERMEAAKAEEVEKIRWIERFLDRDSDDEDSDEPSSTKMSDEEVYQEWDVHALAAPPVRRGQGKMVPLSASPNGRPQARTRNTFFPADPADARAALLSKKSVRTLSYRQQRRKRQQEEDSDDEILCLCNGRDDGRELVQCDGCETWYHLECIGIKDIAELGDEEDSWYCRDCEEYGRRSRSSEPSELSSEPTFAPTDNAPQLSPSYDPPFYQPPVTQDSPMPWPSSRMPQTPTRNRGADYDHEYSSGSSWVYSSVRQPSTPQHPTQPVRVNAQHTPGPYDSSGHRYFEQSPFDPTSTPSRGIKFGAMFTTPKNNGWSTRANGMFQTPLRASGGRNSWGKTFGDNGALSETGGGFGYNKVPHVEETPINSPLASRSLSSVTPSLFDESPVMRFNELVGRQG